MVPDCMHLSIMLILHPIHIQNKILLNASKSDLVIGEDILGKSSNHTAEQQRRCVHNQLPATTTMQAQKQKLLSRP